MDKSLAAILDGPVAERWGRPKSRVDSALMLDSDVWRSDSHNGEKCHCCQSDGHFYHADYDIDDPEAEALWLAHLLDACKQSGRCASLVWQSDLCGSVLARIEAWVADPKDDECGGHWEDVSHSVNDTNLEALARAMLAVPVESDSSTPA